MAAPSSSHDPNAPRWLVLGAAGFIGRAMLAELKAHGHPVAGADRPAALTALIDGGTHHPIDIFDSAALRALLQKLQPAILLNATGHPPAAGSALRDFYVHSTTLMLEAVQAEQPACRVVLLGSAAEYGNSPVTGSSETDILRPLSDYGRAKCGQFDAAGRFAASGLDVVTARLFNPIGPGQGRHQFMGALLEQIRRGECPLRVQYGNHVRDWIDVRDVSRGLVTLAGSSQPPAVVNICTGRGHSVEFVANSMAHLAGVEVAVEPGESSPNVLWHSVGNPGRMFNLGWRPQHELAGSLAGLWRHFS